jgi:hypothetical protein
MVFDIDELVAAIALELALAEWLQAGGFLSDW